MTFGAWLLAQDDRDNDIGDLARAAAKDRGFPKSGDPIDVVDHVKAHMADGDAWAAATAAVYEWTGGRPWRRPAE